MSKNFFEEFIRTDFFEKKASEEDANLKSALGDLSPEVLEKLAQEIGALSDDETYISMEEKLASEDEEEKKDDSSKEDEEEKKESSECEEEKKDDSLKEDEEEKKESSECEEEKKDDSSKEDEEEKKESSEDEETEETEESESPSEEYEKDKEAAELEDMIIKEAYELVEERLSNNDLSLEDYVFSKCANEDITEFITENAEKLASLTNKSSLQIADNIISSLEDRFK